MAIVDNYAGGGVRTVRFNLNNSGSNIGHTSISSGNLFSDPSRAGSPNSIKVNGSINGVPIITNGSPTVSSYLNNRGSNSVVGSSDDRSALQQVGDFLDAVAPYVELGYGIYNNERNYRNEREAYAANQAYLERVLSDQENAIVNQAKQYGEIGLNPLYMSGNGMSYSAGGYPDAPKHGNLDVMTTLSFMDQLKNSEATRKYQQAQTDYTNAKTSAQVILNALNDARTLKALKDAGVSEETINKLKSQTSLLDQQYNIRDYDFDITKGGSYAMRYKDGMNQWVSLINYVISLLKGDKVDNPIPGILNSSDDHDWLNNPGKVIYTWEY